MCTVGLIKLLFWLHWRFNPVTAVCIGRRCYIEIILIAPHAAFAFTNEEFENMVSFL